MIDSEATPPTVTGIDMEPFRRLFHRLRRRTRFWIGIEAAGLALLAVAVFFWASLAVDWWLEPPVAARAAAVAAIAAVIAWILVVKLFGRLRVPLADRDLAMLVERHHAEFADSLSTAIDRPDAPTDPDLLARTIRSAIERLPVIRIGRLFRSAALSLLLAGGLAAVASVAAMAAAAPATTGLWARRVLLLQEDRWPRETSLEAIGFRDGVRVAARGADVEVLARATGRIPQVVDLRIRSEDSSRSERMGSRGGLTDEGQVFGHVIEGLREDVRLVIRGGDARLDGLLLRVLDPPAASGIEIGYALPDYLGGGRRTVPASAVVQVPRGSAVAVTCGSTKPLKKALISTRSASQPSLADGETGASETLAAFDGAGSHGPASAAASSISGTIPRLDEDRLVTVSLTDTDGLSNLRPIAFRLAAVPDQPPQLALRMLGISNAVTPKARIPIVGTIADDHALGSAAAVVRRLGRKSGPAAVAEKGSAAPPLEWTFPVERLTAGSPRLDLPEADPHTVPLEAVGVGDLLVVTVTASDTCTLDGAPQVAVSDAWNLEVVTVDALVAMLEARELMLRRRFENVFEEMNAARGQLAAADGAAAAARMGEAAARAAGETGEIAEAFLLIRREFANNGLLTPELDTRLFSQIAAPLGEIAASDLPRLQASCRQTVEGATTRSALLAQTDAVLERMRGVLDKMMQLETFNEVVELLRSAIRTQEAIREETLKRQKERARQLLERP